ncbi:MAG: NFACT family protein [Alicyclobacillus sp.]|nr:NFACT family protein [Alicyclobacillus sp.]
MDGLALAVLRRDWEARWTRARVEKVHQPGERDLVLTLRVPGGSHRVLLSADRTHPRVHELLQQRPANPEEPPAFCRLLRKRLEGARLVAVRQQGWDRVLELHFETRNELGDRVDYALVCELTGRHSNLLLCEAEATGRLGRIVDSIVHVPPDVSRVRPVLPGLPYEPPPPLGKKTYDRLQADDVAALNLAALAGKARVRALAGLVAGMGGVTAAEVFHRARSLAADDVLAALQALFHAALHATEPASLGLDPLGWPIAAAPFQLTSLPRWQATASLDEALDAYYAQALERTQVAGLAQRLQSALARQQDRLLGKRAKLLEQQAESQNHDQDRIRGELLLAYAHTVPHGAQSVELPDLYHEGAPLTIALDPALSAVANAQRYFRLASKKKRALPILERELAAVANELQYIEEAQVFLRDALLRKWRPWRRN